MVGHNHKRTSRADFLDGVKWAVLKTEGIKSTHCINCRKLLMTVVKFCPFCGHESVEEDEIMHVEDRYEDWN